VFIRRRHPTVALMHRKDFAGSSERGSGASCACEDGESTFGNSQRGEPWHASLFVRGLWRPYARLRLSTQPSCSSKWACRILSNRFNNNAPGSQAAGDVSHEMVPHSSNEAPGWENQHLSDAKGQRRFGNRLRCHPDGNKVVPAGRLPAMRPSDACVV
jgi:hypothetical protein